MKFNLPVCSVLSLGLYLQVCLTAYGDTALNSHEVSAKQTPPAGQPTTQLDFQTDLFTGRFGYSVPMPLAPARHESTPNVTLRYNSGSENGWCGMGWDIDLGYIERDTRKGVPVVWSGGNALSKYDDAKGFVFSLNGKSSPLVNISSGVYRAEIEGGFLKFELKSANNWLVTDTSGNQYYFGQSTSTRTTNAHWGTATTATTFRWALDKILTVNNDTTTISYTTVSNRLYPLQIAYNGHASPDLDALCTVDFNLTTRSDTRMSVRSGFIVNQTKLLDSIVHKINGSMVWSNKLNYTASPTTSRSLLTSITRFGTNQSSSLPTITFEYQKQQFGLQPLAKWGGTLNLPASGSPESYFGFAQSGKVTDLADMDGDGLPDWVESPCLQPFTNWFVQLNTNSGFGTAVSWGPLNEQKTLAGTSTANQLDWVSIRAGYGRLVDINGDGKPDRVCDPLTSYTDSTPYNNVKVELNDSTGPKAVQTWTGIDIQSAAATTTSYKAIENAVSVMMIDINGDGIPDRVMTDARIGSSSVNRYIVQFGSGTGFFTTNSYGTFTAQGKTNSNLWAGFSENVRLIDINGDGLPDRVMLAAKDHSLTNNLSLDAKDQTKFIVELNNGSGFEAEMDWPGLNPQYSLPPDSSSTKGYKGVADSDKIALRDVNGDGLPDRIMVNQVNPYEKWYVQLNTGAGFDAVIDWTGADNQSQNTTTDYIGIQTDKSLLVDLNGDGLPDRLCIKYRTGTPTNYFLAQLSNGPFPDLLTVVSNGIGGAVVVNYASSVACDNHENTDGTGRQLLPFPQWIVSSLSESDGINPANTTSYSFSGGMWGFSRREFNGFAKVAVVDPLGMTNVHYFYQCGGRDYTSLGEYQDSTDNIAKKGMEYRVDTIGSDAKTYKTILNKVEETTIDSVRHFAYIGQTIAIDYTPGGGSKAKAEKFVYDNYGNLRTNIDYGQVTNVVIAGQTFTDTGSDTVYHRTTYASLSNKSILDKPETIVSSSTSGYSTFLRETKYEYDGATGNPTKTSRRICDGDYAITSYAYDAYGNLKTQTGPDGVMTEISYETTYQTFPATETVGGKLTTSLSYDPRSGNLANSTDPKGLKTKNTYDPFLRLTQVDISTTSNGTTYSWLEKYDYTLGVSSSLPNNSVRARHADGIDTTDGHQTWTYMDGLGRAIQTRVESETSGSYRVSDTVYDQRGAVLFAGLPYFNSDTTNTAPVSGNFGTYFDYDAVGRLTSTTASTKPTFTGRILTSYSKDGGDTGSPIGSLSTAYFDGTDPWTIVKTDEAGKITKYVLDAQGRTNKVIEAIGSYTTTYKYDLLGSLTNIVDSTGLNTNLYSYNDLGQVVAMADPDMGTWLYARDSAGRITKQTDANGQKIVFAYNDALGRVSSRQVYDFQNNLISTVSYTYDDGESGYTVYPGQLFKTTDKEGWEKHGYDYRGREVKTTRYLSKNGKTYTTTFSYDDMDRVVLTVYPNGGPTVTNIYNSGTSLSTVKKVNSTTYYTANSFDALGHVTQATLGNSVATSYSFYPKSQRLNTISSTVQSLTYTYDEVSNVKTIVDGKYTTTTPTAGITSTTYDGLHRLTALTRANGASATFGYSAIGNLTSNTEATNSPTYGSRIPHAVRTANGKNYAYDLNGNMLVRGTQLLEYDPENHLTLVKTSGAATTFGYGGDGERLWKQSSTTNGLQVWIGNIYEEKNGKTLYHIYAGDRLVCTIDSTASLTDYYQPDQLRSTTILTDGAGTVTQHYEYTAYGQDRYTYSTTAFPVTRRFTSQSKDDETGLYFYGARYYDPELGRFIQPDDIIPNLFNPQCLNRYSYCRNNPLRYVDPSGHEEEDPTGSDIDIPAHASMWNTRTGSAADHAWGAAAMKTTAAVGREVVELNPVVGGYNNGYQLLAGSDALDPSKTLTGWQRAKSGGSAVLAAAPLIFKAGKFINLTKTAVGTEESIQAIRLAQGAANLVKKSQNDILLGVIEKGNVRLFETAAGKIEGHIDLVKAGLVSKEAQGFSVGVKNGEVKQFFRQSALNMKSTDNNLPLGTTQQVLQQLGAKNAEVYGN